MRTLLSGVHALKLDDPTGYDVILVPSDSATSLVLFFISAISLSMIGRFSACFDASFASLLPDTEDRSCLSNSTAAAGKPTDVDRG
jgi:hypothetical protein